MLTSNTISYRLTEKLRISKFIQTPPTASCGFEGSKIETV